MCIYLSPKEGDGRGEEDAFSKIIISQLQFIE